MIKNFSPKLEVWIVHSVGEALAANTDTLEYTVTGELMHHEVRVNYAGLLQLVGDDATHEVRLRGSQRGHQVVQLLLVGRGHSGEATALLAASTLAAAAAVVLAAARLSGISGEDLDEQFVGALLELIDDSVVQRVLVLLQPTGDVVWYLKKKLL